MKITSPAEGYTAQDRYGDVVLDFKDGVAEHDGDLPYGVLQYLTGAGYGIGSKKPTQPESTPAPPDPRDQTTEQVGTTLRDAAVDPEEGDFLPPTNAGKSGEAGNPHGPNVVAPGIHAVSGPGPIVPGPVGRFEEDEDGTQVVIADTEEQQRRETTAAEEVFIEQRDVPTVTQELGEEVGQPAPEPVGVVDREVVEDLKGEALDTALEERGLTKTGTADEKRARVAEHDAAAKGQG